MEKVQVANGGGSYGDGGPGTDSAKNAGHHDAGPAISEAGNDIHRSANGVSNEIDGTAAVDVGNRGDEQGRGTGDEDVDGQLVGDLQDSDFEVLAQGHKGRIDYRSGHLAEESKPANLEQDE